MNYVIVCVASTAAIVYSYAFFGLSITMILSYFMLKELFCQIFPKGENVGPFVI